MIKKDSDLRWTAKHRRPDQSSMSDSKPALEPNLEREIDYNISSEDASSPGPLNEEPISKLAPSVGKGLFIWIILFLALTVLPYGIAECIVKENVLRWAVIISTLEIWCILITVLLIILSAKGTHFLNTYDDEKDDSQANGGEA